jgi:hypothetical protein
MNPESSEEDFQLWLMAFGSEFRRPECLNQMRLIFDCAYFAGFAQGEIQAENEKKEKPSSRSFDYWLNRLNEELKSDRQRIIDRNS